MASRAVFTFGTSWTSEIYISAIICIILQVSNMLYVDHERMDGKIYIYLGTPGYQ